MSNEELKRHADTILYTLGLLDALRAIGAPHITGSYRMDMMVWNDLDVNVENDRMDRAKLHSLTRFILETFSPSWYEAKEELTPDGKTVWFHGFEAEVDGELWNVDLWFFDRETIEQAEVRCHQIAAASPDRKKAACTIKRELITRGLYGFGQYGSQQVYQAAIDEGIQTIDEFLAGYPI